LLDATQLYNLSVPVNLRSSHEISINNLIKLIADLTDFDGDSEWATFKPDGQPRRRLDTTRAQERFNWTADTDLEQGLLETIEWYEQNRSVKST
jgi:dTDP-glucose 4,6-dehydratase/GDP-L-fucose synthase